MAFVNLGKDSSLCVKVLVNKKNIESTLFSPFMNLYSWAR